MIIGFDMVEERQSTPPIFEDNELCHHDQYLHSVPYEAQNADVDLACRYLRMLKTESMQQHTGTSVVDIPGLLNPAITASGLFATSENEKAVSILKILCIP